MTKQLDALRFPARSHGQEEAIRGFEDDLRLRVQHGVELRPFMQADVAASFALLRRNQSRLARFMEWVEQVETPQVVRDFAHRCAEERSEGTALECVLIVEGQHAGNVGLSQLSGVHCQGTLGYWVCGRFEGRGIITKACRTLLHHGFTTLGLHRIQLTTASANDRSRVVAERLGFRHEGTLREAERVAAGYVDLEVYALLAAEFSMGTNEGLR